MRVRWALAAAAVAAGCGEGRSPAPPAAIEPFGLRGGWTWVREHAAARRVEGGDLLLRAIPGSLWEKENSARNLLLRAIPPPADPVEAEVVVTSSPAVQAEQAGLLWYVDDDHYVKLVREFTDGAVHAVMVIEDGPKVAVYGEKKKLSGESTRLRLSRAGGKLTGSYREGAGEWKPVGEGALPGGGEARIGLFAHGAPGAGDRWARFGGFRAPPGE
jgi:regulation of enolase protein 1 (concanavalin A-like superfamily)